MTLEQGDTRTTDRALTILLESRQATRRFHDNFDQWKAIYPDQWVAVSKDGLVAHNDSLDGVIAGFKKEGYKNTQVIVKFLNTKPRAFLL